MRDWAAPLVATAALLAAAPQARAQQQPLGTQPQPPGQQGQQGQPAAQPQPVAQPQPGAQQPPGPQALAEPLPVLVVALPDAQSGPVALATRDALVAALRQVVRGRPVQALDDPARVAAIAACTPPPPTPPARPTGRAPAQPQPPAQPAPLGINPAPCIGAQLAEARAVAGVLVRTTRPPPPARPARPPAPTPPVELRIEVVDPVSGAPRLDPIVTPLSPEAAAAPAAAIAPLLAQIAQVMPPPPPQPSTLLVAVNVDGASVTLDDREIGRSPVGPVEIPPGTHVVQVHRSGFSVVRRNVDVAPAQQARVDIDLSSGALAQAEAEETPFYARWYVIGGAAVLAAGITVAVVLIVTADNEPTPGSGIPVPPIVSF